MVRGVGPQGPTILLASGNYFSFTEPENSIFTVADIAQGLSMTCRFGGHTSRFYSVAQHSVHASYIVPEEDAFAALMHDAPEAFIGDIPKPLKNLLPDFQAIEKKVEEVIFDIFQVPNPLPESVKHADLVMLVTEQHQLMRNFDGWSSAQGIEPLDWVLPIWSAEDAAFNFIMRFAELTEDLPEQRCENV